MKKLIDQMITTAGLRTVIVPEITQMACQMGGGQSKFSTYCNVDIAGMMMITIQLHT